MHFYYWYNKIFHNSNTKNKYCINYFWKRGDKKPRIAYLKYLLKKLK